MALRGHDSLGVEGMPENEKKNEKIEVEEVVPGDAVAPTSPRQGPATHMVTQDRGRRTSDEGVATLLCGVVASKVRSPVVAWHVSSEQPEVCCGDGELGTTWN